MLARTFGVEVRTPFYDRELVEFGARIPAGLKLEGIERTKRLFRQAMRGVLPDVVNARKDKLGHSVPLKNWLRLDGMLGRRVREALRAGDAPIAEILRPATSNGSSMSTSPAGTTTRTGCGPPSCSMRGCASAPAHGWRDVAA